MNKLLLLKVVLWLICLYHVFMGAAAFLSEDTAARVAEVAFGIHLQMAPQTSYIVKLLGVYAIVFGLMVALTALDPVRYTRFLDVVVVLYALRILNKLVFAKLFTEAFEAPPYRAWVDIALLAAFGLAVFLLKPRSRSGG
jgi:hypothetical protein